MIKRLFTTTLGLVIQLSLFSSIVFAQASVMLPVPSQVLFDKVVDEYFDFYFQFHPTAGTQAGLHQYDGRVEDFSRSGLDAEIAGLAQFQKQFSAIQSGQLSQASAGNLQVLTSSIQARLLEL